MIAGIALFLFGLYQMLNSLGVIGGHSRSYSSSGYDDGAINETWLIGTWTPETGPRCATWVRFNPDHTLTDEGGGRGTWRLRPRGDIAGSGDLTLTMGDLPPRTGQANRFGPDQLGLGGGRHYRRASC